MGKLIRLSLVLILYILLSFNYTSLQAFKLGPDRQLIEVSNSSEESDDTVRVDPLDRLNKYRGGYDIRNLHYWSSTVFTGIYGYAIGVAWLLCGFFYGIFLLVRIFCSKRRCTRKTISCQKQCYLWLFTSAIFFTILAVIASGVVLGGNARFHSRTDKVVDIIIDTADGASDTIYNTTKAMKEMSVTIGGGGAESTRFLTSTSTTLDARAADIQRQARKHRKDIEKGLRIVYIVSTVIVSLNLVALIALSVSGLLRFKRTLYSLIVLCWILTVLCWFLFGIYFFINKFAGDTCRAFESFQQDPYNSSLSLILPCDELVSAKSVMGVVSGGIYRIVSQVNKRISKSYGNFAQICQPFSRPPEYAYQADNCPPKTIPIGDIPQLLHTVACTDPGCIGGILISTRDFNTIKAYTSSIQNILNVYPGMERLVECKTVNDAFSKILENDCSPLKRDAHLVWAASAFLSVVMVALVLIWTVAVAQEPRHRGSLDGSVRPRRTEEVQPFGVSSMETTTIESNTNVELFQNKSHITPPK
ncbi:unnamed protein product [Cuscuta campestris]|uniref:Uncharacterized protein n=1 Tax=Cuscuta campestris TaxID=132261 RepID=A0A484L7X2_9ASTE|nr:unnamed protein product [Cuscuta campestris]